MTLLCLGEAIVDLVCERPLERGERPDAFVPRPGGALANTAVAARRAGVEAALLGGVGDDPWGRWLRQGLRNEGVGTDWLAGIENAPTPLALVSFDRTREPSFLIYGESISTTMAAAAPYLDEAIAAAGGLLFGSNTLVSEPERRLTLRARGAAFERGIPILFDPNLRRHRWQQVEVATSLCREACEGAFAVRANLEEAAWLTGRDDPGEAALGLCDLGARIAVVTLGAAGAVMRGAASAEVSSPEVEVISPLGAGDAFMGTLAAGFARSGWEQAAAASALPAAAAAGAAACTRWSAQ